MNKQKSNIANFFLDLPIGAEFQVKVQTASMSPLLKVGDSVLVKKIEFDKVRTGDVICFYQDLQKNLIIHRVVKKEHLKIKQNLKLITKGDALQEADQNFITKESFVGLVVYKMQIDKKTNSFNKMIFTSIQRLFFRFKLIRNFVY